MRRRMMTSRGAQEDIRRGRWRGPLLPFLVRRLGGAILTSMILIATLPLLFVQQPTMLESDLQIPPQPGRPNRAMSRAERDAIRAVLDHRACTGGITVAELLDTRFMGRWAPSEPKRWPGGPSWPTGSYAVESEAYPGTFSVHVPYQISGVPDRTGATFHFWYYAETGIVGGALTEEGQQIDLAGWLGAPCRI
jgi:hypothetical protein